MPTRKRIALVVALTLGVCAAAAVASAVTSGLTLNGGQSGAIACNGVHLGWGRVDRTHATVVCDANTTTTVAPTTTTTAPPPPQGAILFASVQQLGTAVAVTHANAIALARSVDVISAFPGRAKEYAPYWAEMKQVNPRLKGIIYINGSHFWQSNFAADFYAHTASGQRIVNKTYNTFLMNITPGSPWVQLVIQQAKDGLKLTGWDGTFLDSEGSGACAGVHPGTNVAWTASECLTATNSNSRAVQNATGKMLIANGLADGSTFFAKGVAYSGLLNGIAGGDAEEFPQGRSWIDNVNMLETANKVIMTNTKFNPSDQWHRFTLGTFALGTNGLDVYFFNPAGSADPAAPDKYLSASNALGQAVGAYKVQGNLYLRQFQHGLVIVNPTGTAVTVSLPRALTNLDGQKVTSERLGANSGDLLVG